MNCISAQTVPKIPPMLAARADIDVRTRLMDEGRLMFRLLADLALPIIVAMQGDAIGLGATILQLRALDLTARELEREAMELVPKSSVPKFRPGADFKALVNGDKPKS